MDFNNEATNFTSQQWDITTQGQPIDFMGQAMSLLAYRVGEHITISDSIRCYQLRYMQINVSNICSNNVLL